MIQTTLNGKTTDIAEENIQKLKQIFPDVFTEGKVDLEKLQQVLGTYAEDSVERYNFTWNGKGRALRLSQTPSQGTLRPCKEESKDWDTTQNLYIEGDNLEVLKLLQKSYHAKVKMIYIDPPYNTGKDFVYPDDFHDSLENYKKITGQVDNEGNRIGTNTEASGRYHTEWLNMMYPRLRLARNLLSDDGVIFISIDDNEVDNLKKVCNEVFGEDNFISEFVWQKKTGAADAVHFAVITEYILVFAKNINNVVFNQNTEAHDNERYKNKDDYWEGRGPFYYDNLDRGTLGYIESLDYGVITPDGTLAFPNGRVKQLNDGWRWKWGKEKLEWGIKNGYIELKKSSGKECGWSVYYKIYMNVDNEGNKVVRSSPYKNIIQGILNTHAANEAKVLFGKTGLFSNPKPSELLKFLVNVCTNGSDTILDFFSGSATTAHGVMQLNAEDGGNRKFICVQLPEPCDESSEAFKSGYKNICEIGKERIRRAGDKIKQEKGLEAQNLDIGFKVLKLDTSNIRKWQPDYEDLEQTLLDHIDNYVDGRTELDVVYEIMLKYGLDLTYPVDEFTVAQKKIYSIGFGMLMICLDDEITTEVANGILVQVKELAPESTRVVFKDNGFNTDSNKTNIKEILKCGGIEEFITV